MKKLKLFILAFLISSSSMAQEPVSNIKVFDIYDNYYSMYTDILDNGKYLLIDFFSVNCGSCQVISPVIDTVFRDLGCNASDIFFMAIDYGATNEQVFNFTQLYSMSYPAVSGNEGGGNTAFELLDVTYTPFLLFISPQGEILFENPLIVSSAQLLDTLSYWGFTNVECQGNEILRYELFTDTDTLKASIDKENQKINIFLSENTDLTALKSNFVISPNSVAYIGGNIQEPGVTVNDFSSGEIMYSVFSETAEEKIWTVAIQSSNEIKNIADSYLKIFPNPATDFINISFDDNFINTEFDFEITDISGRILDCGRVTASNEVIKKDLSALQQGLYFINFRNSEIEFSRKIFIAR